jgi:hypothetical protein
VVGAGRSQVQGQPGLHSKFKAILMYIARPCLKNIKDWGHSSAVELLLSIHNALASVTSTSKTKKKLIFL